MERNMIEKINIIGVVICLAQAVLAKACPDSCGEIFFGFPFRIGKGCYLNKSFEVTCNHSFSPPKPFLTSINMELLDFSSGQIQVNNPIIYSSCSKASNVSRVSLSNSPFVFSNASNRFTARGCDNYAIFKGLDSNMVGGCLSICNINGSIGKGNECYGIKCCQVAIPPYMQSFEVSMINPFNGTKREGCKSAFMANQNWFAYELRNLDDLINVDHVPATLDWAANQGYCDINREPDLACTSDRSYCWKEFNTNQVCICSGCEDFRRCTYECQLYCMYTPGGYNCSCPSGYDSETFGYETFTFYSARGITSMTTRCYPNFPSIRKSRFMAVVQINQEKKGREAQAKVLQKEWWIVITTATLPQKIMFDQTKLFTSTELEKATDYYNMNRILGQGGQGTVYKGMLTDGRVVAVKKSKVVDEDKLDQFINEVVILSQINHRNVVKLIGCCLETEVPLLVYEFIPNGTLFHYIHNQNDEFPITWEMRLRIATEVAGALFYLHSAASIPIYHRDIKSSNILLDEKYRSKVADFGTSKSVSIDQTHVTTRAQGTFGYLDPEYFQSSQFTEKSDVYSFGVVLVELLTGQKPISCLRTVEERSLATYFLTAMEENNLFEILDAQVAKEGGKKEIIAMAKLAQSCLNLNGKKRPTMKTVAIELEGIRSAAPINEQAYEEVDYSVGDGFTAPWDVTSSTGTGSSKASMQADQPLLHNQ